MTQNQDTFYSVFRTRWGWFGVLANEQGLLRTCLPVAHKEAIIHRFLLEAPNTRLNRRAFSALEKEIKKYYKGESVSFSDIKLCLSELSEFQQKVLRTLRTVKYGRTITYSELARRSGCPKGARAIGTVMAQNPLPLIIPCHRVIKADGTLGLFSAAGGIQTKQRMLELERNFLFS